jgi:hypothetical protein
MTQRAFLFAILMFAFTSNVLATSPCMSPTKEWFNTNVIQKSDLVVFGTIEDYSNQNDSAGGWTKINVLEVLKGNYSGKELTINNWQAVFDPLYINQKGSYAVIWLKNQNSKYYITDLDWNSCVPSVWDATDNKTASSKMDYSTMSLEEIKKMIAESSAK